MPNAPSIHASCVLVGAHAVLIRGPSGSGKSRLVHELLGAGKRGETPLVRLVSDDRTLVEAVNGRLIARPVPALKGLLELRHIGILTLPFEAAAVVGLVVDLAAAPERFPQSQDKITKIDGISLPYLALPSGAGIFPLILAKLGELQSDTG